MTPISLLVDDSCPLVHSYRWHHQHERDGEPRTRDGRLLVDTIPNEFLDEFCDVAGRWGLRGKLSIVPSPSSRGDVVRGVNGDLPATRAWLETARRRLGGAFDFSPEMITHDWAVDLATGRLLSRRESVWSQTQDRATLTPYISRALQYLRDAGVDATGVTSPWIFGKDVETEYVAAIVEAQRLVYGRRSSWYFLHTMDRHPQTRPWVQHRTDVAELVSIPTTVDDVWWKTIEDPRDDEVFVRSMADEALVDIHLVMRAGGWPILVTHWQSLFSNGSRAGLRALNLLGRLVRESLGDAVVWESCSRLMDLTLVDGRGRPDYLPIT